MKLSISRTLSLGLLGGLLLAPLSGALAEKGDKPAGDKPADKVGKPSKTEFDEPAPGKIVFHAKSPRYTTNAEFKRWHFGEVYLPADLEQGQVEILIDMTSISDPNTSLTERLKSVNFFQVDKFPRTLVTIRGVKKDGTDHYTAKCEATILGITSVAPCEFKVTGKDPMKIEGTAKLNRDAFHVYRPYNSKDPQSVQSEVLVEVSATLPAGKK